MTRRSRLAREIAEAEQRSAAAQYCRLSTPYHSLVERDEDGRWQIVFGDYDKAVVREEYDVLAHGRVGVTMKIVTTGDAQADIDAAVAALNEAGQ